MATYTTSLSQTYGPAYGPGHARQEIVAIACSIAMTTAMLDNANDEVELGWAPEGFVVTGVALYGTDMDTNGTPALVVDVGDDSDEDRLIAAATTGQTATSSVALASTGFLYKYATRTKVKLYINTAAATAAAGTYTFMMRGFVDPNFSATNAVVS